MAHRTLKSGYHAFAERINRFPQGAPATDRLFGHLEGRRYVVGDRFTRADLTAAALLAPLYRPAKYGLAWPDVPGASCTVMRSTFRP